MFYLFLYFSGRPFRLLSLAYYNPPLFIISYVFLGPTSLI